MMSQLQLGLHGERFHIQTLALERGFSKVPETI